MKALVVSAANSAWAAQDMGRLANILAASGARLRLRDDQIAADVASTGGPSSLSTLLCPLYLRCYGFVVPKLGVPGRPAGGVDVLAQLPGYRTELTAPEVHRILDSCGYAHFLAGAEFAPLDAALFQFRQKVGAQNLPAFAVASILAKKIACGVRFAGLDVRVAPHGNFGSDYSEARISAAWFCSAAAAAGISAAAALTDGRTPYQPYIGRGESVLALRLIFEGRADPWLIEHNHRCRLLAANVAALHPGMGVQSSDIQSAFVENVIAQGSSKDAFYEKAAAIEECPRHEVRAARDGFFWVDLSTLRPVFTDANSRSAEGGPFSDFLGIILKERPGAYVHRGDLLGSVRADDATWIAFSEVLTKSFLILDVLDYAPGVEGVVRA